MHRLFRSSRPGRPEYASLILFLIAWLATMTLVATPMAMPFQVHGAPSPILPD